MSEYVVDPSSGIVDSLRSSARSDVVSSPCYHEEMLTNIVEIEAANTTTDASRISMDTLSSEKWNLTSERAISDPRVASKQNSVREFLSSHSICITTHFNQKLRV